MTPERLKQIDKLFAEALELAPPERHAFLVQSCGADLDLLAEVESLLAQYNSSTTAIDGFRIMFKPPTAASPEVGTAEPSTFKVGDFILKRFRIIRLLGCGGMGEVYEAQDLEMGRIALKTIREDIRSEPAILRFKKEVLLARMVTNTHVCRIHELFTLPAEDNRHALTFLTMEFLEGTNLADRIAEQGPIPWRDAESIALQLCQGLEAIHNANIVHRDFKSRNVMLTSHNGAPKAVVMDMGLAHGPELDGTRGKDRSLTLPGTIMGTPHYMAPEQFEGGKTSAATDIYAFGVVLYEMVTGKLPFESPTPMGAAVRRAKRPPPASSVQQDVPHRWDTVIETCLKYEPKERYQSAGELAAALRSHSGRITRIFTVLAQGASRYWLRLVLASLALLVAAVLGVKLYQNRPAPKTVLQCAGIPPLAAGKYLAVLPFRGEGSFGVAEAVTEKLSTEFPSLAIFRISSNVDTVAQGASPQKAACDLGANLIVQGTIVDIGDSIRVHWALEDMEHGKSLVDENVLKRKPDVVYLVNDICSRITTVLDLKPQQASPPIDKLDVYALYGRGQRTIRDRGDANRFEEAFRLYGRALALDHNFVLAYAGLADAYYAKYDETKVPEWAESSVHFAEQAVALSETLPEAQLSLGSAYTATGKTDLAIQHLKRGLELRPNSDSAYRRLGRAYLMAGEKDNAIAAFKNAVDENPYYWNNHYELGVAFSKIGRRNEALREFRIIQDRWPDQALGYAGAAGVYYGQGKFQEAKVAYEKAIALEPSLKYSSSSNLGTVYFFLKDYKGAIAQFELAVGINPNDDLVHMNLADAYRWSNQIVKANLQYDEAIRLAIKRLETNPRDTATIGNLALYYAKRGKSDMALKEIRRALLRDRNDSDLIYDETVVKTLANQPGEALAALRKLLVTGYSIELVLNDPELNEGLRNQRPDEFDKLIKEFEKKSR